LRDQPHVWRNLIGLTGDFATFAVGLTFFDPLVIVPAFAQALTGSEIAIGALSALRVIMITLPQIWAASLMASRPRKKPLLIWSSLGGRLPLILLALSVLGWSTERPWLVMGILGLAVLLFYTSEGFNSIFWPDIVGKVLPASIRGRFLGLGQLIASGGALAASFAVHRILTAEALPFPANWALLFGLAFAGTMASVGFMGLIHEEPTPPATSMADLRKHVGLLVSYLRRDRRLQRIIAVQVLLYSASAAFPFFVIRAQDLVADPTALIGNLLIVQSLGGMLAALACGYLVDRVGSYAAVRVGAAAECLALALAVVAPWVPLALPLYLAAFFLIGLVTSSIWWVFTTYLMDIAADDARAGYFATSGVLTSPTFIVSLLIGATFHSDTAELVFGAALLLGLVALALSMTLARVRAGQPID
jgi:hypothetical protein